MNDLPEGWITARIGDVIRTLDQGWSPKCENRSATTREWGVIKTTAVQPLAFVELENKALPQHLTPREDLELQPGDLLITRAGPRARAGVACLVKSVRPRLMICDKVYRVRVNAERACPEFIELLLNTAQMSETLDALKTGMSDSGVNLTQSKFLDIKIEVPPLAEQRRIVAKVAELRSQVNCAKDRLARVPTIIKRFRQSVLASACSGKLTEDWRATSDPEPVEKTLTRVQVRESNTGRAATDEVIPGVGILSVGLSDKDPPSGWKWLQLTDVAKLESGHTPSRKHAEYWNGKTAWIGILDAGAHHGGVINDTFQTITQAGLDNSAARILPAGTVCLSRTASVGYVVIMGRPMATSQDFVNWVCSEALVPEFLAYALMAEGSEIKRFGRGSTHTTIYFPEVKALHICLPPVDEQREIVRRISQLLPVAETISKAVYKAAKRTDRLTEAVLAKAFRGELVPTEAELAVAEGRDYEFAAQLIAPPAVAPPAAPTAPLGQRRKTDKVDSRKIRHADIAPARTR